MRRGNRAIGPPPGTMPAPTSNCDRMALSRLAKRMSQASASSLPTPVARPRSAAEAYQHVGNRRQSRRAGQQACGVFKLGEKIVVRQEKAIDGAVEDDNF